MDRQMDRGRDWAKHDETEKPKTPSDRTCLWRCESWFVSTVPLCQTHSIIFIQIFVQIKPAVLIMYRCKINLSFHPFWRLYKSVPFELNKNPPRRVQMLPCPTSGVQVTVKPEHVKRSTNIFLTKLVSRSYSRVICNGMTAHWHVAV